MEWHVVAQGDVHRKAARWRKRDRVAVGIRFGDQGNPGQAAGAGAVFNHHGLTENSRHLLDQDATDRVGWATGWKRYDESDGAVRKLLSGQNTGPQYDTDQAQSAHECSHLD